MQQRVATLLLTLLVVLGATTAPTLLAQETAPGWPALYGGFEALDGDVTALVAWDDGSGAGPRLVAGGGFTQAGDVAANHVALWDGHTWSALGDGFSGPITAFLVDGADLYAASHFGDARVARWTGTAWEDVGTNILDGPVYDLAFYDDGTGRTLYAAGSFHHAGATDASGIARLEAGAWTEHGGGLTNTPFDGSGYALLVWDDGNGEALYVGGEFTLAGTLPANHIARWDGAWSNFGGFNDNINDLVLHDDGSGPVPFAGGAFSQRVRRWTGTQWVTVVGGPTGVVRALTSYDDGSGPALFAGTAFPRFLYRWDGFWSHYGSVFESDVRAFATLDLGAGNGTELFCGAAEFQGTPRNVGRFDGTVWRTLGNPMVGTVLDTEVFEGELFAAGLYAGPGLGSEPVRSVARWEDERWVPAQEFSASLEGARLVVFDAGQGAGPELYAHTEDNQTLFRRSGNGWTAIPGDPNGDVRCAVVYDDGGGEDLYLGGEFTHVVGQAVSRIARYDGSGFSAVGAGIPATGTGPYDMIVYDDGGGADLYVTGSFPERILRWDGAAWSSLGTGLGGGPGRALAVYDDGGGSDLYVAGDFLAAGGLAAQGIARWDGTTWSSLGQVLLGVGDGVRSLAVGDLGDGEFLYMGGAFQSVAGVSVSNLARWNGTTWFGVLDGTNGPVESLQFADDGSGSGPALFVAGGFTSGPTPDSKVAKFGWAAGDWAQLGGGTPGVNGVPDLSMSGPLSEDGVARFDMVGGPPAALALLFISTVSTPVPLFGGTLYPFPADAIIPWATDGAGEIHLTAEIPALPPQQELWFQVALEDGTAAPWGATLSTAMKGTVP